MTAFWHHTRRAMMVATQLAAIGLAVACALSWLPVWPCSLFEHFRPQLAVLGLLTIGAAAVLRHRVLDLAAVSTLLTALPVAASLAARPGVGPRDGAQVRVLVLNVRRDSAGFQAVAELIARERPDVIGLVEVDERWLDALAPALASYAGRIEHPQPDNFGLALYARGAVDGGVVDLASPFPTIAADVSVDGATFHAVLTHPIPPISGAAAGMQDAHLDGVAAHVNQAAPPIVVMGDLNATPWSRPFVRLQAQTGLCDSRAGFGVQGSFPASSALLRIPIDHLLASCTVGVRDRRIGPDVGSDHLPVIVDLVVPRSR